jgi:hypothetical protein
MPITERVELHDGGIRLAAQVSRPNAPGVPSAAIVAPGGTQQGEIAAYNWIASRLADAVDVREGGAWKIRLLTNVQIPPPAKTAR